MAIQFSRDIDTTSTQVSRQFRHIVDEEPGMQYKIELHASGYADNEANTCTRTTERLKLLRLRQSRWKSPGDCYWERINLGDSRWRESVQAYDNLWATAYIDFDLLNPEAGPIRPWHNNVIKFVCFEEETDETLSTDSWTLIFPFTFENIVVHISRGLIYLIDHNLTDQQGHQCYRSVLTSNLA